MDVLFFPTPADFRDWLDKNHQTETELWVGFYKKASKKQSITWPESVDQALCYGWIDGLRKSIDKESYKIRFTPRRPTSIWSDVNIGRIEFLTKEGLMKPAGIAAWEKRKDAKSGVYSYEQKGKIALAPEYEAQIRNNPKAWTFFQNLAPSYKKSTIRWIMSAKREETRQKRVEITIESSAEGLKIPLIRRD
jgi:uncharacterized protein YdeI (YjbR/CyaY-like superfamily)